MERCVWHLTANQETKTTYRLSKVGKLCLNFIDLFPRGETTKLYCLHYLKEVYGKSGKPSWQIAYYNATFCSHVYVAYWYYKNMCMCIVQRDGIGVPAGMNRNVEILRFA